MKDIKSRIDFGIKIPETKVKMLPPLYFTRRYKWLPSWFPFNSKLDYL